MNASFDPRLNTTSQKSSDIPKAISPKELKNLKIKELGVDSLNSVSRVRENTNSHKTTALNKDPTLDFLQDVFSDIGVNNNLFETNDKLIDSRHQLRETEVKHASKAQDNEQVAKILKNDAAMNKKIAQLSEHLEVKAEFGADYREKTSMRDLELLTTRMSSRTEVLKHTQVFHFQEGGVALRMSSLMGAKPEVMDLARENPRMMAQVVNRTIFVHPDSGFRAGSFIQVLDDNEEPQVLLVEFFKPEQLRRMEFICLNFMNDQVESKLEKNEAGRSDAPRAQRDESGKEVKGPGDKQTVADGARKEPVVAKQLQREEQHRDEDAALLRGAKKKDQQAIEKQDGVVRNETLKTEEKKNLQ